MAKTRTTAVVASKTVQKAPPAVQSEAVAEAPTIQTESTKKPVKVAKAALKPEKTESKKEKLIRDSFTLPESDYAAIKQLKERCLAAGIEVKKSEIVRVALNILAKQTDQKLISAVKALPRIKTGRPKKAR
ncbi:hypothetical protein [Methyloterricola oryzae]|uniref:hypothetical protein n=1 Tax=Methyloterricola oryzae TaxID=1495050 RepID=UPI0011AED98F|nr:hypothetical protein [Methyloterricola oryzae]